MVQIGSSATTAVALEVVEISLKYRCQGKCVKAVYKTHLRGVKGAP
jgi:hypothetical protein